MAVLSLIIGIILIAVGVFVALKGLRFSRFLIPFVIAAFGFSLVVQGLESISSSVVITYSVAAFAALIFFIAGYFFYKVAIVLEFASIGFLVTIVVFHLIGMDNSIIPFILAFAFSILAGLFAVTIKVWNYLILFGTALSGAAIAARGFLTVFLPVDELPKLANNQIADLNLSTYAIIGLAVIYFGLLIGGIIYQLREAGGFKNVKNFEMSFFKLPDNIVTRNTKI